MHQMIRAVQRLHAKRIIHGESKLAMTWISRRGNRMGETVDLTEVHDEEARSIINTLLRKRGVRI